jgi:hypothetical protein
MKRKVFRVFLALLLVTTLGAGIILSNDVPVNAATYQDVTVTATPQYLTVTNAPGTWTINDLGTGSENTKGKIAVDTVYYANPVNGADDTTPPSATVVDGECNFTGDDTGSTLDTDWVFTWGSFSGGDANMSNSDDGTNGAISYGAYSWYSGMTYASKVIVKSAASDVTVDAHTPGSLKWGVEIETQTNAWTGGSSSTSTLTLTITADA